METQKMEIKLTEKKYDCGCHIALYKKAVMVKICRKHYSAFKGSTLSKIIAEIIGLEPEEEWKKENEQRKS